MASKLPCGHLCLNSIQYAIASLLCIGRAIILPGHRLTFCNNKWRFPPSTSLESLLSIVASYIYIYIYIRCITDYVSIKIHKGNCLSLRLFLYSVRHNPVPVVPSHPSCLRRVWMSVSCIRYSSKLYWYRLEFQTLLIQIGIHKMEEHSDLSLGQFRIPICTSTVWNWNLYQYILVQCRLELAISAGVNDRVTNTIQNVTLMLLACVWMLHDYLMLVLYFSIVCNGVMVFHYVLSISDLYCILVVWKTVIKAISVLYVMVL